MRAITPSSESKRTKKPMRSPPTSVCPVGNSVRAIAVTTTRAGDGHGVGRDPQREQQPRPGA